QEGPLRRRLAHHHPALARELGRIDHALRFCRMVAPPKAVPASLPLRMAMRLISPRGLATTAACTLRQMRRLEGIGQARRHGSRARSAGTHVDCKVHAGCAPSTAALKLHGAAKRAPTRIHCMRKPEWRKPGWAQARLDEGLSTLPMRASTLACD